MVSKSFRGLSSLSALFLFVLIFVQSIFESNSSLLATITSLPEISTVSNNDSDKLSTAIPPGPPQMSKDDEKIDLAALLQGPPPFLPPGFPGSGPVVEEPAVGPAGSQRADFKVDKTQSNKMTRMVAKRYRKSKQPYVRTCHFGSYVPYSLLPSQCPKGLMFKEPFVPSCVCLRGVWILHRDICDDFPMILIGRQNTSDDCYTINFNISSLLFLGDVNSPFETRAFVAPRTMTVFYEIPINGTWTPILEFDSPVILAINPAGKMFEAEESNECFAQRESDPLMDEVKVHIWSTGLLSTRYRQVKKCQNGLRMVGYEEFATHNSFYYHSSKLAPLPVEGCVEKCTAILDYNGIPIVRHGGIPPRTVLQMTYPNWLQFFEREDRGEVIDYESLIQKQIKELEEQDQQAADVAKMVLGNLMGPPAGTKSKRKRRQVVSCDLTWDGVAVCLKNYWEPLVHFEMTDGEKILCYPSPINATPRPPPPKFGRK